MSTDYIVYSDNSVPKPFGIVNSTGAACWFNALMQSLLSLSSLNNTILATSHLHYTRTAQQYNSLISSALSLDIVPDIEELLQVEATTLFFEFTAATGIHSYAQQCAREGLDRLIELLHSSVRMLFDTRYQYRIVCNNKQCRYVSVTMDSSIITKMTSKRKINTNDEFVLYMLVHNAPCVDYTCPRCYTTFSKIIRQERLKKVSEVLAIQFDTSDILTGQYYPEYINIPTSNSMYLYYRIVAKIEHTGGSNGGHYTSQVYRRGKWYKINDSTCTLDGSPSPSPGTFIVMYHMYNPADAQ
jgi:ubiquitin C-terminal hydrolase